MTINLKYKRILLKLSGESLMGEQGHGIDPNTLNFFSREIKKIHDRSRKAYRLPEMVA